MSGHPHHQWRINLRDKAIAEQRDELVTLKRERAELLAAFEGILPFVTGNYWPGVEADAAIDRAVAIARKVGSGGTAEARS